MFLENLTGSVTTFASSIPFVFVGLYLWVRFVLGSL